MSVTSFLNESVEARQYLAKAFAKPSIRRDVPLLVTSNAARPGEIGTAFDYLFRFYLQRINPHVTANQDWVADQALPIIEKVDRALASRARVTLAEARRLAAEYVETGKPTDAFLRAVIELARLDPVFRARRGFEYLNTPVGSREVQELGALLALLEPERWHTTGPCLLNPTFGIASTAIGGADADALVGSLLVDLKSTKMLELTRDDFFQIVCYRLLYVLDAVISGEPRPPVDSLGIYFARYGYLAEWTIHELGSEAAWADALGWLGGVLHISASQRKRLVATPAPGVMRSAPKGHRNGGTLPGSVAQRKPQEGKAMSKAPRYEPVPVDAIELDTTNPRIAHALSSYQPPYTAEQIYLALNSGGLDEEGGTAVTFNKLKQSIHTNGGISQPVHLREKSKGKYVSIEGNTRVAIYQEFKQQRIPGSWDKIPAFVYSDLPDEQLHAIRLQAHLVGPRQWDPYSKAKYLHYLRNVANYPFERLVDLCGGNKRSIQESLEAYDDMEGSYRPLLEPGEPFDTTRFSGFVELQKAGVKQVLQQTGFTVKHFAQWIRGRKIERLADVRALPRVLRDPGARQVFLDQDIDAAKKVLELPEVSETLQRAGLVPLCRALTQAIQKVEFGEFRKFKQDPGSPFVQEITEAFDSLKGLMEEIGLASDQD